jgi:hypothetical protein
MFNIRIEKGKQKIMNNYKKNDARITMELQWQNSSEAMAANWHGGNLAKLCDLEKHGGLDHAAASHCD